MATPIKFNDAAREEFDEAFNWYADQSHGAAIGLAAAVDVAVEKIASDPERFPRTFAGCRYCRVERYPFCIVFYRSNRGLYVVAIAHEKRRPGYWQDRL